MRKPLLFTFLLAAASACMAETTSGLTILFKNQTKVSFAFASKPEIAIDTDGITITSTASDAVSYTFDEVQKFYFEDNLETGIQEVKAESVSCPVFSYKDGAITVSGLNAAEQVSVFTVGGSKVGEAKADNAGCASLDLSGADSGFYVVSTGGGVSFKLLKK
jgi:hypothetical protein